MQYIKFIKQNNLNNIKILLLFKQSRQVGFALSITQLKEEIHFRDNLRSAILT